MSDLERDPSDPWTHQFEAQCREAVARGERLAEEHLKMYTQKDVAAERERCAKIADSFVEDAGVPAEIAYRIRSGE